MLCVNNNFFFPEVYFLINFQVPAETNIMGLGQLVLRNELALRWKKS